MLRQRRSGPYRLADDFACLLTRESLRIGKRRSYQGSHFVNWAALALRRSRGSLDRLGMAVAQRLCLYLYGPGELPAGEARRLEEKGKAFARRHRLILAEQVLASSVDGDRPAQTSRGITIWPVIRGSPRKLLQGGSFETKGASWTDR